MRRVLGPLLILTVLIPALLAAAPKQKPGPGKKTPAPRSNPDAFKTPLQSMVAAEQAFARLAAERGIRASFLANLSEDCVVFRRLPVNGLESYRSRPATSARLKWGPTYGEIAASGDFGVTSGPWEYTPPPDQPNAEASYGTFLSVWRRDPGKEWKVVLDCGVSHPKPDLAPGSTPFVAGPEHAAVGDSVTPLGTGTLRTFDGSLSRMVSNLNPPRAVVFWTTNDLRFLRDGDPPRLGDDARNAMSATPPRPAWRPIEAGIARSGDLGFTYGVREDSSEVAGQAPDSTVYVHIWRRQAGNQWKVCAVVDNPLHRP